MITLMSKTPIGIFDTGIGGEAIANELMNAFPDEEFIRVDDEAHAPYGGRSNDEITQLTDVAIQPLIEKKCQIIVIACSTATCIALPALKLQYPDVKFIGIEPMVKTAAEISDSGKITVCATPATLKSDRYAELKKISGKNLQIQEPDCSDWARMIEAKDVNVSEIKQVVADAKEFGSDVIVLGCTHYRWILKEVEKFCGPDITVLESSKAIAQRVAMLTSLVVSPDYRIGL